MPHGYGPDAATVQQVREQLRIFPLKATSDGRSWEGVYIDEFDEAYVDELNAPPRDHTDIAFCTGTSPEVFQDRCGKTFVSPSRIGEFSINPAGRKSRWRGLLPAHLDIRLDPGKLEEMAGELRRAGLRRFEFVNGFRLRDPFLDHAAAIFRLELRRAPHPAQDLLIESIAVALSAHLLRSYTNAVGIEERSLASTDVSALGRAVAYIEDHPDRSISLRELAGAAGLSPFHFSRVFKRHFGQSPSRYVERRRIEGAKPLIVGAQMPLAAVAQAVGFADQSHFTRRFRAHEGCTPAQFAREHAKGILPSGK
jgi:AraC family transcriptional regulator